MPAQSAAVVLRPVGSIERGDHIHALFDAERAGIENNVVVVHVAPFEIGVELIVERTALVLVAQAFFGRLLGLAVFLDDALGALLQACVFRQS